jgi:hypothetical protein
MTYLPVSELFYRIIIRDYPYNINQEGQYEPKPNTIFTYMLSPIKSNKVISTNPIYTDQLHHTIITPYTILDPTKCGIGLHKWAIDTFCRQIDTLSTQSIPVMAACKQLIADYEIEDDYYSLETLYRTFYKWKRQHDTSDHALVKVPPPMHRELSKSDILHSVGIIIAENLDIFYTTKHKVKIKIIQSICQYYLYTKGSISQSALAKIYNISQPAISHNITTARRFINHHAHLRASIARHLPS